MYYLLGEKEQFAIEIEILSFEPSLYGRTAIWLGNERIGRYEDDENILGLFMRSLMRIANQPDSLWNVEFQGLNPQDIFLKINPFWGNIDAFDELGDEDQIKYVKYDDYLFQWGENFDQVKMNVVVHDGICLFFWFPYYDENGIDITKRHDKLRYKRVPLENVRTIYKQLYNVIPIEYWPSKLQPPNW